MATIRFKDPSPYSTARPPAPGTDFLYTRFQNDVSLKSEDTGNDKIINIALFGFGRAGSIHLRNLVCNPRVLLLYIVDDLEKKWEDVRRYWKLDDVKFLASKDKDRVFKDPRVDAVIVASPTFTHEEIVTGALSHGKAVFCEKPIAENNASTENCYRISEKENQPLFCAFNKRFDPSYSHIRERVRSGEVGHVQIIKICSRSSPLASLEYLKSSGGIFHDSVVHDIDVMCWILGEYPTRVAASAQAHIPEIAAMGDHDTVAIIFNFPSGTLGVLDWCRYSPYGYDQRLEVFGPRGIISCANERPMPGVTSQTSGLQGSVTVPNFYSFPARYNTAYANEMEHFLDVLQGKAKMATTGSEAMAVIKIATACADSAKTGHFVDIEWGPEYEQTKL
ncbi:inositol 2-dehydrogenase-like isoform X1 [Periplaneta americana]|uniref:inositol 2-dehydrogenase-like isoform X1 n=1 Tax=Periplaneta americana TaxID=6978 RepID=UPI0037E798DA